MKKFLTLMLAVVLVTALALPAFAAKPNTRAVPEGYNEHDYNKLVAFLEQTDDAGVKNGKKLSENYDPADPKTWGEGCFEWIDVDGKLSVRWIKIYGRGISGKLDVSGCTALWNLQCYSNSLTELDVSGCTALDTLQCGDNSLTELDITQNTALVVLTCYSNSLTDLDVSNNTALERLYCMDNCLKELDLSNNPLLPGESIKAEGSGYIGYRYDEMFMATANAAEGATFLGWYNEAGEELSTEAGFEFTDDGEKKVIAKFSESAVEPDPTEAPVEPTEAPVEPTEVPVEPTEAPVEPQPTGNPGEPTPVPPTGAISVIGIGVAALIAGAGVFAARKKND